uniref:Mediator of RNA polymerase II transcription subunit 23 n=1 Tax=Tetranychus urticae TaxID=32264 RepID=A0A158P565_TETUR
MILANKIRRINTQTNIQLTVKPLSLARINTFSVSLYFLHPLNLLPLFLIFHFFSLYVTWASSSSTNPIALFLAQEFLSLKKQNLQFYFTVDNLSGENIKPANWAVTDAYLNYMKRPVEDLAWNPELDYYFKLISRVVDTFQGKSPFPHVDWRFNEFANAGVHALHITCIELMALPVAANVVANNLIDLVVVGHKYIPRNTIEFWNNAIGVVLTALPEAYWSVINDRIISMMESPLLTYSPHFEPFQMINFMLSEHVKLWKLLSSCTLSSRLLIKIALSYVLWTLVYIDLTH